MPDQTPIDRAADRLHDDECSCGYTGEHSWTEIAERERRAHAVFASIDLDALTIALHDAVCPLRDCEPVTMSVYRRRAEIVKAHLLRERS